MSQQTRKANEEENKQFNELYDRLLHTMQEYCFDNGTSEQVLISVLVSLVSNMAVLSHIPTDTLQETIKEYMDNRYTQINKYDKAQLN